MYMYMYMYTVVFVDLLMNFHQSFKKCSILTPDIRKTTSKLLRINLKGIKVQ